MSDIGKEILNTIPQVIMIAAAFAITVPQQGQGQSLEFVYLASEEEVAAADCAASEGRLVSTTSTLPIGSIHGRFNPIRHSILPDTVRSPARNPLFYIHVDNGFSFYLSAGGNSSYDGDLVAWNNSWLLCPTGGIGAFSTIDVTRPFIRILPDEESLRDDGHYERFRIQYFWRAADPMLSEVNYLTNNWVMDACDGVPLNERCIPFDVTRLDISYAGLDDVSFLSELTQLEYLDMSFNPVRDLSPLRQLIKLQELDLGEMRTDYDVLDISPLGDLQELIKLDISENVIDDLGALTGLTHLEQLIAFGTDIEDVTPLSTVKSLRTLQLQDTLVTDLSPLGILAHLEALYLNGTNVLDLSALKTLPRLEILGLPDGRDLVGQAQIRTALAQ